MKCLEDIRFVMELLVRENKTSNKKINKLLKLLSAINLELAKDKQKEKPLVLSIQDGFLPKFINLLVTQKEINHTIGIAGESACGKTTFVSSIMSVFSHLKNKNYYTSLCCDDYYLDTSDALEKVNGSFEEYFKLGYSFDTPDALNLELLNSHLEALKNNIDITSPKYDFVTCKSELNKGEFKKSSKIIILEGLFALNEKLHNSVDIKVYIDTPFDIIKERWFKRAASRGKTGDAANVQFNDVNNAASKYIRPHKHNADIVLNGCVCASYIVEFTQSMVNAVFNALKD